MSSPATTPTTTFSTLYTHLLTLPPPLLPPPKPTSPSLTSTISSLALHPTLEAAFHLLNNDLPSAHFLCRHMQAPPAYEGMYLHGILHRLEGDYDNARAWYGNVVGSEVFREGWWRGREEDGVGFVGRAEGLRKRGEGDKEAMGRESVGEIRAVVEFCRRKFGEGEVRDARGAWKQTEDEAHRKMGQDMVSGGKGFRQF